MSHLVIVTPPRDPDSIRRTTSIESTRPNGLDAPVQVRAHARDLLTPRSGQSVIVGRASLEACIDYWDERHLLSLRTDPSEPCLVSLVGLSVAAGFRSAVATALADRHLALTSLHRLLDDLPGAALVSGHALLDGGSERLARLPVTFRTDVCAGWRADGLMASQVLRSGHLVELTKTTAAPIEDPADPLGWQPMDALPPHGMRRQRLLDLSERDALHARAILRDTHADGAGRVAALHEYQVIATIDPESFEVREIDVLSGALPSVDCGSAAEGAQAVVGVGVADLQRVVRSTLTGASSCTHLNDVLRSLQDVVPLTDRLRSSRPVPAAARLP
jgi:hypothetical protein